jgi:hypothetical protein
MVKKLMKRAKRSRYQLQTRKNLLHNKRSRIRKRGQILLSRTYCPKWSPTLMPNMLSTSSNRQVLLTRMPKQVRKILMH